MAAADRHGCPQCWPEDADAAWDARGRLVHELRLVDDSHFIVGIRRCDACHQRFLTVFSETIDWNAGEDPQYRQLLPVDADEIVRLAAAGAAVESLFPTLGVGRRALHRDFPSSGAITCVWRTGLIAVPHD